MKDLGFASNYSEETQKVIAEAEKILKQFPEEIDEKYENRKIRAQKLTVEKLSRLERQRQVYVLDLRGFKNKEIAEKLTVSESTVEKDLLEIRLDAKTWFKEIASNGMAKTLVDAYLHLDEAQKELWKIYRESENESKIKVLGAIIDASVKKKELFWASDQKPSYHDLGVSSK